MEISCYLAMTAAEMAAFGPPEEQPPAYMACHFSPYGTGLSNCPEKLPPGTMLIVNDRTPICGHDLQLIADRLEQLTQKLACSCVLLDLQRPDCAESAALCRILAEQLSCTVAVSDLYAQGLSCPVFLPPVPLGLSVKAHLAPWAGREIWLEAALDACSVTVTAAGSSTVFFPWEDPPEDSFTDELLHCRYRAQIGEDSIRFTLWRGKAQLNKLLQEAKELGVNTFVGLYQQLG